MAAAKEKEGIALGIIGGLIGTLCCWPVWIFLLLGLSGVAVGLSFLVQYVWYLRTLGAIFLAAALYYQIKRRHGVCNLQTIKLNKVMVITAIAIYVILLIMISLIIRPLLTS